MEQIVLNAEPRAKFGSREAEILRQSGRLPANIYGHKEANVLVSLDRKEFTKFLGAGHRFVTIRIGKKDEPSVVKEVQYDFLGTDLIHVDFTRISRNERVELEVPIETIGSPKGLSAGYVLDVPTKEVLISGFPQDIPEHLELNIETLELGQVIRLKDLPVPANCVFVGNPEQVIVTVIHKKLDVGATLPESVPAQPEVIGKKKEEGEESAEPEAKKKEK